MILIGAYANYTFDKGFILNEEKLRKIHDLVSKRISDTEVKFTIFREDAYSFETNNIDDIINQDKWSKIKEISIKLGKDNKNLNLLLDFNESGVNLKIDGESRDIVFILFSDLKDFISKEVCFLKTIKTIESSMLYCVLFLFIFAIIYYIFFTNSDIPKISNENITNLLESNDTNVKINFIVKQYIKENNNTKMNIFYWSPVLLGFVVLFFGDKIAKFFTFLYPSNLFLFGKEIDEYKKKIELRKNIFWTVLVALLISIIGSLIVWIITSS